MIIYYAHGGSDNHGCEAIIRGTNENIKDEAVIYSGNMKADERYGLNEIGEIRTDSYKRYNKRMRWFFYKVFSKLSNKSMAFMLVNGDKKGVYLSVGGDNYCYPGLLQPIIDANERIRRKGNKTVLWGVSIEPEVLKNIKIRKDIKNYDLIFARESLTYNALINIGLKDKTFLYPDPAFAMKCVETTVPKNLFDREVIGINISPLILKYENGQNIVKEGYLKIIQYILNYTDCNIALIPHVVKRNNNDLDTLHMLQNEINDNRIYIIEDNSAEQLKYCISKCAFFIGARTHSTIAAYSTCVPTLVIGYSIKARGIAIDLFGSEKDYVVDVRTIDNGDEILTAFKKLYDKRSNIKLHLEEIIPDYINKTKEAGMLLTVYINNWMNN